MECGKCEDVAHTYEWIVARRLVYEVQSTEGGWAVHDGPTYSMIKECVMCWERAAMREKEVKGWEGAARVPVADDSGTDKRLLRRTGGVWWEGDEEDVKRANGQGPPAEDAQRAILQNRWRESERLVAVYAAREQRTRMVEGKGDGWRQGRACSLAEWTAARGAAWEVVTPQRRRRGQSYMKIGAPIEIYETSAGSDEGHWELYRLQAVSEEDGRVLHELQRWRDNEMYCKVLTRERWRMHGVEGSTWGGMEGNAARVNGRRLPNAEGGSRTAVEPARLRDVWLLRRQEMKDDAAMVAAQCEMGRSIHKAFTAVTGDKKAIAGKLAAKLRRAAAAIRVGSAGSTYTDLVDAVAGALPAVSVTIPRRR